MDWDDRDSLSNLYQENGAETAQAKKRYTIKLPYNTFFFLVLRGCAAGCVG